MAARAGRHTAAPELRRRAFLRQYAMKVLITGGAGFIGAALARAHLERGDAVTIVDNLVTGRREQVPDGAQFHLLDVGSPALEDCFEVAGPFDVVSHYAALKDVRRALVDPYPDAEANILGTLNVLRCAAGHGTGLFVFPSSAAVYGDAQRFPTPETAPAAPISPYGISKAAAEAYCAFFARNRSLPAVALRYSTVYGPTATEESEAGVITNFTRRLLAGRAPIIYGDGEQTRDLVSVDDVVRANLLAIERGPRPWAVYNVATGVETSVNDLCRTLAALTGFQGRSEYQDAKPGEVRRNVQDASLIRRDLGWAPSVSLKDGLARVVEAYRQQPASVAGD
ncbi:MAG: NAD-dependent epimerase/dehydratase family protein [Chloroflexota bacterium]